MQEIKIKLVKDYMKKRVVKFSPEDSIFKVAKVLSKKHISGGPVVKKGKLVGVISESDIIKFMQLKFPGTSSLQGPHMLSLVIANLIKDQLKFKKVELRIGKIIDVQEIPGSKNLYKLVVDFGGEKRQAISGIRPFYKKEELLNKKFVFVTNLERKKFFGEESQCMILAAEKNGKVVLIQPEKDIESGAKVR